MMALTFADSLAPQIGRMVHNPTSTTAGRLMNRAHLHPRRSGGAGQMVADRNCRAAC